MREILRKLVRRLEQLFAIDRDPRMKVQKGERTLKERANIVLKGGNGAALRLTEDGVFYADF